MSFDSPLRLPACPPWRHCVSVVAFGALLLGGCSAAGDTPETEAPSPAASPTMPAQSTDGDNDGSGNDASSRDFDAEPLDECIVGSWLLESAEWRNGIEALVSRDLDDVAVESAGALALELRDDQGYTVSGDEFTTITTGGSTGGDLRWTLGFDGSETGTWYVLSEILILDRDAGRQMTTTNVAELDGQVIDGSPTDPDSTPWSDDLGITCDDTTLVATPLNDPEAFSIVFARQP